MNKQMKQILKCLVGYTNIQIICKKLQGIDEEVIFYL